MAPNTTKINLKQSICTDTPLGADLWQLGDPGASHLENTGIERNSGITPIYEKETTFPTAGANSIITADGSVLQVDASNNVRLNDSVIGNVGPCSVYRRGSFQQYIDIAWTVTGTIIGIKRNGTTVILDEYDLATDAVIHTRNITFAGMPTEPHICLYFVNYVDMAYADNQEFIVVTSAGGYKLAEAGLTTTAIGIASSIGKWNMYRFSAGRYLLTNQGHWIVIGDIGAWTALTNLRWSIIDRYPGTAFSRAIVTRNPTTVAATVTGYAIVGYSSAGVWSAVPAYYGVALGAATATIINAQSGPGYCECTYTRDDTGAIVYTYMAPDFQHTSAVYHFASATYHETLINAYGKLSDIYDNRNTYAGVRWCMINGMPSYLAIAPVGGARDNIGVPITNVGEIDTTYCVKIDDDNTSFTRIIYQYNSISFYIEIKLNVGHVIQKLSDTLYLINCISAINIYSDADKRLHLGMNDYNGRMFYIGTSVAPYILASMLTGPYSNSIDVGAKTATANASLNSYPLGIDLPLFVTSVIDYWIDVYQNGVYESSYNNGLAASYIVLTNKLNIQYIADTRIPFAMGYLLKDKIMQTEIETIFTGVGVLGNTDVVFDYAGYEIGNQINNIVEGFYLYGQRYLFDGNAIYIARFAGPIFQGRDFMCDAKGMQLLATSPTLVYFLSSFDNSIYTYDGGRSLSKFIRMNQEDVISNGVFDIHDNSLLLNGTNNFIWVRDGIVSENAKKATQTGITLYSTALGIVIANNTTSWRYTFFALSGSTVVQLVWKSGYYGVTNNKLGIFSAFVPVIYSASRAAASVIVTLDGFDTDGEWHEEIPFNIKPGDWTPKGFYRHRVVPQHTLGLAIAIGIRTSSYVVLNEVVAEFTPSVSGTPASDRSK